LSLGRPCIGRLKVYAFRLAANGAARGCYSPSRGSPPFALPTTRLTCGRTTRMLPPDQSPVNQATLLIEAQKYCRLGWSVFPLRQKEPAVKTWKPYQTRRAGPEELDRLLRQASADGLGVVAGSVSGHLGIRDFDSLDAYEAWSRDHTVDANRLPTA